MMDLMPLLIAIEPFFIKQHGLFVLMMGVLGLMIGSFINVVAHRTPRIMMNEWRHEISQFIAEDHAISTATKHEIIKHYQSDPKLSLSYPRSHCPHCQQTIPWWQNIPLISHACLLGRCAFCRASISLTYPATELLCALLSMLMAHHFGMGVQAVFAVVLVWFLLALSLIDLKVQLLPDRLLVPCGIVGLIANLYGVFTTPSLAIWGLVLGFVSLWLINAIFKLITKKDGMGLGDAKLLAVLGAWLGAWALPLVVFIGALLGVLIGAALGKKRQAFAFGPYLAVGGVAALLWGEALWRWYLNGF